MSSGSRSSLWYDCKERIIRFKEREQDDQYPATALAFAFCRENRDSAKEAIRDVREHLPELGNRDRDNPSRQRSAIAARCSPEPDRPSHA
jgi:hypothetical protein